MEYRQHGDGRDGQKNTSHPRQLGAAENCQNHPQRMHVDASTYESRKDHVVLCKPECAKKREHPHGPVDRMKADDQRRPHRNGERTNQRDELEQAGYHTKEECVRHANQGARLAAIFTTCVWSSVSQASTPVASASERPSLTAASCVGESACGA